MFRAISIIKKKEFYSNYNFIIYYLQRIPLIGKLFKNKAYNISVADDLLFFISTIWHFIKKIFSKLLFYGIIFGINLKMLKDILNDFGKNNGYKNLENLQNGDILFYLISFSLFLGVFAYISHFYENTKENYLYIKQMKMNPREYHLSLFFYDAIIFISTFTISNRILFLIFGINIDALRILYFVIFGYSLRYLAAVIFLKFNFKSKTFLKNLNIVSWICAAIIFIGSLAIIFFIKKLIDFGVLYDVKFGIIGILIFVISTYLALKRDNIEEVSYRFLNYKELSEVNVKEINKKQYSLSEKKLSKDEKDFSKYSGIEYINKIFFHRTLGAINKKLLIQGIVKSVILIVIAVVAYFSSGNNDKELVENVPKYYPLVIFASGYLLFNADFFIKYCFANMDYSLLKYSYYRRKDFLIKSVKIRMIQLLKLQSVVFLVLIASITSVAISFKFSLYNLILCYIYAIVSLLFFTLHYLFAYYIIQPFNKDIEAKNPLYSMLTWLIYMISYISIFFGSANKYVSWGLLVFCIIYVILGFVGIKYLAVKRFKLK
ncbi:hypothetical protein ABGF48_04925 [Helcococcus bovis]|uniref:hypothetical protein n=1 Tax=Helcococcus bovis TaxID=3153252 RepID=UPI0038B75DA6